MFGRIQFDETASGLTFDVELPPGERLYCLIGENGAGKTSFLESLGAAYLYTHIMWLRKKAAHLGPWAGMVEEEPFVELLAQRSMYVPTGRIATARIKDKGLGKRASLLQIRHRPSGGGYCLQPIVWVTSDRRASLTGIGPTALSLVGRAAETMAATVGRIALSLEREPIDTATVAAWIAARLMVNPAFVVGLSQPAEAVLTLLRLLRDFDPERFGSVVEEQPGRAPRINVVFEDGAMRFMGSPIDRLASGYIALIKMLQEIVSTIAAWEAMRDSTDILGSDALIFIDEIDAHLHPRWQRRLLPFLKRAFPNATFIVTTHSALIVRDTAPGEAHELVREGDHVTSRALGSPRDWYLSDVYSQAFHVDLPPTGTEGDADDPPVLDLLLDYSEAVRGYAASKADADRDKALALHAAIGERLPADDPRLQPVARLRELLG